MTIKPKRKLFFYQVLLVTVALLICASKALTAIDSKNLPTLDRIRADRRLRATVDGYDYNYESEDRAFTGITKLKEFAQAGTKKLQKAVDTAKTKLTSKPTIDQRFKQFKVDQVESNVFESMQFNAWAKSVAKTTKNNQDATDAAMLATLATHYGDETLARMLDAAKQVSSTKSTATRLENAQISKWVDDGDAQLNKWLADGVSADSVYKLLRIDAEGSNLLKSPKVNMWMSYLTKLNKDPYDVLLYKVRAHYDDVGLAKMFVLSKKDSSTKVLAEKLETLQLEKWMNNKNSAADVFRILKLNQESTTLLKNPVLTTWVAYVEKLQKNPYEMLFSAIKAKGFDDVELARLITAAKQDLHTGTVVAKLEKVQLQKWATDGKTSGDLFKYLGLYKAGDKFLDSPVLNNWFSYMEMLRKDPYTMLVHTIRKSGLDEVDLARLVNKAKQDTNSKTMAANVEKMQLGKWSVDSKTSDDVFKLLRLDKEGDKVFESPVWSTWTAYLNKVEIDPDADLVMYTVLRNKFGDEGLANLVAKAKQVANTKETAEKLQLEIWRVGQKSSDDIFNLLKLNEMGTKLFENPGPLRTWIAYVNRVNSFKRNRVKVFQPIIQLEKRFGEEELAVLLVNSKAKHYLTKAGIAEDLQEWQFKKWMAHKTNVDKMFPFEDHTSIRIKWEYKQFYKENADSLII
ncbi:hypothetical protein PInf_011551 [Phytophthora infestans]|nr:hypothetical protein PInf_011551 [Phytophthora infestans]